MIAKPRGLTPAEVELAAEAAKRVVETHQRLVKFLRPGQTLAQIDTFVAKTLESLGSRSCFLGYKVPRCPAFPSHACLSLNDCIVHGTAGYHLKPLQQGDLLKIDIGVFYRGWVGDAAWTYSFGPPADLTRRLMDASKEALALGVKELRPANTYLAWARVVQDHVERARGFHLTRGLGGHGIGRHLHGPPFVSNVVPAYPGEWPDAFTPCTPGTLVAVEPMVAVGTGKSTQAKNSWPIFTADHSLAVHHEHDVLITEGEPRVLTKELEQLPDVIEC